LHAIFTRRGQKPLTDDRETRSLATGNVPNRGQIDPTLHEPGDAEGNVGEAPCLSPASFWKPQYLTKSAWLEHAPFVFWLVTNLRPAVFVELGTHSGFSYFAFCQAVQHGGLPTACHAVDTWTGDEHTGFYGEEVFNAVNRYNERHYSAFSRLMRLTFDSALNCFAEGSIDLLHIDGRHRYEDVARDFSSWRAKLSDRAIVIFHDISVREREFGVWRLWHEIRNQYPSFEFTHGHGLGVLFVGPVIPDEIRALIDATDTAQSAIRDAYTQLGRGVLLQYERVSERVTAHASALVQTAADTIAADEPIRLICATREPSAEDFYNKTALGRSLAGWYSNWPSLGLQLFPGNREGLAAVYNRAISGAAMGELLVFLHDDLHLIDLFWADELRRAVAHYDIVGLAGNRRRVARQPSWAFVDQSLTWDGPEYLSGSVAHGKGFPSPVSQYGSAPQKCLLLDGLLLAVRSQVLHKHGLRFDERFQFHFYDMDFCRQAEELGLSMGTWPVSVIHESGGSAGSESWRAGFAIYLEKWGE
jgi:hypothetical protein